MGKNDAKEIPQFEAYRIEPNARLWKASVKLRGAARMADLPPDNWREIRPVPVSQRVLGFNLYQYHPASKRMRRKMRTVRSVLVDAFDDDAWDAIRLYAHEYADAAEMRDEHIGRMTLADYVDLRLAMPGYSADRVARLTADYLRLCPREDWKEDFLEVVRLHGAVFALHEKAKWMSWAQRKGHLDPCAFTQLGRDIEQWMRYAEHDPYGHGIHREEQTGRPAAKPGGGAGGANQGAGESPGGGDRGGDAAGEVDADQRGGMDRGGAHAQALRPSDAEIPDVGGD